jgi:hypothetical protein
MSHLRVFALILLLLGMTSSGAVGQAPDYTHTRISNPQQQPGQPDGIQPGGDRENSYAWCMESATIQGADYIYVGSNRDLLYMVLLLGGTGPTTISQVFGSDVGPPTSLRPRIFRWKSDGSAPFQLVYTAPTVDFPGINIGTIQLPSVPLPVDLGYRGMQTYNGDLYAVTMGALAGYCRVIRFNADGSGPDEVLRDQASSIGGTMRAITVYNNLLTVAGPTNAIYASAAPPVQTPIDQGGGKTAYVGWTQVASDDDFGNPSLTGGGLWQFAVFDGWLYAVIGQPTDTSNPSAGGFELFKGRPAGVGDTPNAFGWTWVKVIGDGTALPRGLGNPANAAASPYAFGDHLFLGTFMDFAGIAGSGDFAYLLTHLAPCQIYRLDAAGNCEMVIGDPSAAFPTRIGNHGAGFFDISADQASSGGAYAGVNLSCNEYLWWMEEYGGKLYATTFDIRVFERYATAEKLGLLGLDSAQINQVLDTVAALDLYNPNPAGFDMYVSSDGVNWDPVTQDGFGDAYNYGGRTLKTLGSSLLIGTANPFWGAQVHQVAEVNPSPTPTPTPTPTPSASPTPSPSPSVQPEPQTGTTGSAYSPEQPFQGGAASGGGGCFVATAAFGSPLAPQIGILRQFRDQYLLTHGPGRAFVAWYYREGPKGAAWLNAHAGWKSVVRLVLYPVIGIAWMFVHGLMLPLCVAVALFVVWRRRRRLTGAA